MSRLTKRSQKAKTDELKALKGWQQIAKFLGQPVATSQRWAKSGMPVGTSRSLRNRCAGRIEPLAIAGLRCS
ncbi:MAG: hypothetical protein DMG85_17235 [Acidobacteria bacterium]|nr:MAG: hypothetical protein DMG85_17235 [Acidobacteriota bacterium]